MGNIRKQMVLIVFCLFRLPLIRFSVSLAPGSQVCPVYVEQTHFITILITIFIEILYTFLQPLVLFKFVPPFL